MENSEKVSKIKLIFAEDIMTEEVVVVNQKMTIGQVAHLMLRERVSGYPVVDDAGKVSGIITLTDLFVLIDQMAHKKSELPDRIADCKKRPISDIMSKDVMSISPKTPLDEIIHSVVEKKIHTFPVMDNDKLVGIIGRHDVLNATFVYG